MENGDLRTFLRACRPDLTKPRMVLGADSLHAIIEKCTAAVVFLESQHLVHRGLMARHFLVGRDHTDIRLASLGHSRDIYIVRCP